MAAFAASEGQGHPRVVELEKVYMCVMRIHVYVEVYAAVWQCTVVVTSLGLGRDLFPDTTIGVCFTDL